MSESVPPRIHPKEKFPGVLPYPQTKHELDYLLRKRHLTGLDAAVIKLGRRVFIDERKFTTWLASHAEVPNSR